MTEITIKPRQKDGGILLNLSQDEYWALLGMMGTLTMELESPILTNIYNKLYQVRMKKGGL
jgi:hypothetical protein